MKKTILDDGFHNYLVENVTLVGEPGIPQLVDMHNVSVPKDIIPFEKARKCKEHRKYIHFYMHDKYFSSVLTSVQKYIDLFQLYDGIITPDCTMLEGQAKCLLQTSTYFNRAIGAYLQKQGIPVIPNIRWSNEDSYPFCFLGAPQNSIVAISTHGCISTQKDRDSFRNGLSAMLDALSPTDVVVHGYMPEDIFGDFLNCSSFHRYPSWFERTHRKGEYKHGARL